MFRSVSEPCLPCSKDGRKIEARNQLKIAKSECGIPTLQDGEYSYPKPLIKKGGFMVKLDLSDAYCLVPMNSAHRRFLRCFMNICSGKPYYCSLYQEKRRDSVSSNVTTNTSHLEICAGQRNNTNNRIPIWLSDHRG